MKELTLLELSFYLKDCFTVSRKKEFPIQNILRPFLA
jgi:hypothetical protein